MIRTREYISKTLDIFSKGGTLWLIERTDTGEFCYRAPVMFDSSKPETFADTFLRWKDISFFHVFFLNKEDAEKELPYMNLTQEGLAAIPVAITEHIFHN